MYRSLVLCHWHGVHMCACHRLEYILFFSFKFFCSFALCILPCVKSIKFIEIQSKLDAIVRSTLWCWRMRKIPSVKKNTTDIHYARHYVFFKFKWKNWNENFQQRKLVSYLTFMSIFGLFILCQFPYFSKPIQSWSAFLCAFLSFEYEYNIS